MSTAPITVVIPTVAPRVELLKQAVQSVAIQELWPSAIIIEEDTQHLGAPPTRQAGLDRVTTEWTAFLDDDDLFRESHLRVCWEAAQRTGADVVYPWFDVTDARGTTIAGGDPWPERLGQAWNPEVPYLFPISYLVKTDLIRAAGGFSYASEDLYGHQLVAGEDWRAVLNMNRLGTIHHEPVKTWIWRHWGSNSSGLPQRVNWDTVYWRPESA